MTYTTRYFMGSRLEKCFSHSIGASYKEMRVSAKYVFHHSECGTQWLEIHSAFMNLPFS